MGERAQDSTEDGRPAAGLDEGETLDALFGGDLRLIQRRRGYRFSVDPLLLAAWTGRPGERAIDLGAGCGVLTLLLARRGWGSVVGIEVQQALFELAVRNVALNQLAARVEMVRADFRALRGRLPPASFDLVVSNPPYVAAGAGRTNAIDERAIARHELMGSLPELATSARGLLKDGGALKVVFPASRLSELFGVLGAAGLGPKRMRLVFPVPDRPARMVLFEAVKGSSSAFEALPPLYLFSEPGIYTPEAREILGEIQTRIDRV